MFQLNEDLSIYATRGDIVFFTVSAEEDGEKYTFKAGDVVRIKIYGKKNAESIVLEKDFPVTEDTEEVEILLTKEDTKIGDVISKPKDYWYEVELNPFTNPQTIIGYDEDGAKVFKLFPEGADIPAFEPTPEDIPFVDDELDMTSTRPVQNQAIARAIVKVNASVNAFNSTATGSIKTITKGLSDTRSELSVERSRIDNLLAGSTPSDSELIDVRVGADGKQHGSAGTAIRTQIGELHNAIQNDCFLFIGLTQGEYVDNTDGSIKTMGSYERTDYLDVSGMGFLHVTAPAALSFNALYDADKNFIKNIVFGASEAVYELPDNAHYLMMSAGKGLLTNTIVKNNIWKVANLDVPKIAKEASYDKRGKEMLNAVFTIGTMLNGVIDPGVIYRVTTRDIVSYDRDITLRINDADHQFGVATYNNGEFVSQTGWIQSGGEKFIPANTQFRVVVAPIVNAWATADIDKLSAMMEVDTVIADRLIALKRESVKKALFSPKKARFVAHRGLSAVAPENTLSAFIEAGKAGAYAIETDVYATSDGYFVLSHDDDISVYTNAPSGTKITENTLETVQSYTITKGANVDQYAGQKIPTLEEYLEICILYGCVPMIEIKNISGLFNELVEVVNSYGFNEDAIYINYKVYYATIRKANGDCIVTVNLDGNTSYDAQIDELKEMGAYNVIVAMSPAIAEVTEAMVQKCHSYGYLVNIWTLNSHEDAEKYFRMGVDMVTSDLLAKL